MVFWKNGMTSQIGGQVFELPMEDKKSLASC
jgi:hypothetical protein